jgi:hypothetical protein
MLCKENLILACTLWIGPYGINGSKLIFDMWWGIATCQKGKIYAHNHFFLLKEMRRDNQ